MYNQDPSLLLSDFSNALAYRLLTKMKFCFQICFEQKGHVHNLNISNLHVNNYIHGVRNCFIHFTELFCHKTGALI